MKPDVKKLVLSLLPYVFIAWLFGKGAECYRLSDGADMVTKLMGAVSRLGDLLSANPLPSFHPRDLQNPHYWAYYDLMEAANGHTIVTGAEPEAWHEVK